MEDKIWRRFVPLKEDTGDFEKLVKEKELNHDDLILIMESMDVNHNLFQSILESRQSAQKN